MFGVISCCVCQERSRKTMAKSKGTSGEKKSMTWIPDETRRLLEAFRIVKDTNKERNTGGAAGLSSSGWNDVIKRMNQQHTDKKTGALEYQKSQVQSKIKAEAADFKTVKWMQGKTGIGFENGIYSHDKETKKEMIEQDKNCAKFFKRAIDNYDLLTEMFWYVMMLLFVDVLSMNSSHSFNSLSPIC